VRFLTGVRVTDFRSIAAADLSDLGDVTPIVGLNGSGKSNLLRALNLMFNNKVEGTEELDLRRDFREPGRRVKLRILVEIDLNYGVFESLRPDLEDALAQLAGGAREITICKEWTLDPGTRETVTTLYAAAAGTEPVRVAPEQWSLVTRLLNVVRFRYVSNHIHPSRILEDEETEIRRMLFDRLGKRQILQDQVVESIGEVATELMHPIVEVMSNATGEVASVELDTPEDWRDLAWAFGMKLSGPQSQSFDALLHGSGVQSVLAYSILHAVDTSFSGSFGWRKGAIWAVEEPESFLHIGLQQELARLMASYAEEEPLQILLSTHATPFLGVAPRGLLSRLDSTGRTEFTEADKSDLLREAFTSRIAPYAHALHTGPPKPLLMVEGVSDRDLLIRAYTESGTPNPYDIRALPDMDENLQGGDELARWLRYNRPAIAARPDTSPIIALRDWESGQGPINQIQAALDVHTTSRCVAWPRDLVNRDLSERFVGIERFLSTEFIEQAAATIGLELSVPAVPQPGGWRYDVDRAELTNAKSQLHQELAQRTNVDDLAPLVAALPWLSGQLAGAPPLL
jgi:predicted ATPase